MNAIERKAALTLSSVFALRMLGLFMLLPVFTLVGQDLQGYTPALIGFAIGAYGLTQALLQIPFGWLSDRVGRKPVIIGGLVLFALGSLLAAFSDHIYGVIAGRLLQGCGAIASAVMALAADLSRDEQRSKIMASIGFSIGIAFIMAMVLGPGLTQLFGLQGLFLLIAALAFIAIFIVHFFTPTPDRQLVQRDAIATRSDFASVLKNGQLMRLNFGIFVLHFLLTTFFVVFPSRLIQMGFELSEHSWIYLATMILSAAFMLPLMIYAEKKRQHVRMMLLGVMLILSVLFFLGSYDFSLIGVACFVIIYFIGFNLLEAMFPSMISRVAPPSTKGTALGVYSTFQFMGAFLGGPVAGMVMASKGVDGVYLIGFFVAAVWAISLYGLKNPPAGTSYTLTLPESSSDNYPDLVEEIRGIEGVLEVVAVAEAKAVYLKIDKKRFEPKSLDKYK
jgi:MFS family permease